MPNHRIFKKYTYALVADLRRKSGPRVYHFDVFSAPKCMQLQMANNSAKQSYHQVCLALDKMDGLVEPGDEDSLHEVKDFFKKICRKKNVYEVGMPGFFYSIVLNSA